jgi:hypothetical protein
MGVSKALSSKIPSKLQALLPCSSKDHFLHILTLITIRLQLFTVMIQGQFQGQDLTSLL